MVKNFENLLFLTLLLLISAVFVWLMKPFFGPLFWAIAIAIIFAPVQTFLQRKLPGRPNLTALITLLTCLTVVIFPVVFCVVSMIGEAAHFYTMMESGEIDLQKYIQQIQEGFPTLQIWLAKFGFNLDSLKQGAAQFAMSFGKTLAQQSLSLGQNALSITLGAGIMLYVAFFFLRDGHTIVKIIYRALPLGDTREQLLFTKFAEVTRATVKGNLVVAAVQGAIGGLTFAALGIEGALFWGVMMAMTSMIPAIGASLIWLPVALYLFATGLILKGTILVLVGALGIGLIDNILRPILVGRDTKLPDYLVLLSTLGGLSLVGINGFVMGPLIAALFLVFWDIFIREFHILQTEEDIPLTQDAAQIQSPKLPVDDIKPDE